MNSTKIVLINQYIVPSLHSLSAYIAVLAAAVQHNHGLTWALTKLSDLGLPVGPDREADIYDMYVGILSGDRKGKNRNSNNACKESCVKFNGN